MMVRKNALLGTSCGLLLILSAWPQVGAHVSSRADQDWAITVETLPSPAGANSAEPQLTAHGGRVTLSWIERNGSRASVKLAGRTTSGWSDVRTVVSGTNLFVNAADVPSALELSDRTLVAHWLREGSGNPDAYDVRLSWSKDGGVTWSQPTSPHHDGTQTEHGFASLFNGPNGGVGIVWLDGRKTNPEAPEGSAEAGDMGLRAAVYGPDRRQRGETLIAPRVCECCSTSVAETSEGLIVAFRSRSATEVRDVFVSRFADGHWSAPTPVHEDGWQIKACPINGPALSARDRDVAVVWFTMQNDEGHTFLAFSRDGGRTFGQPVRVDDVSSLGKVSVALLQDGSAAVSWIEFAEKRSQLKARRIEPSGVRSNAVTLAGIANGQTSGVPRLVLSGDELLFAWTETNNGTSQVRTARAALRER
ncbi:MAG TPA: sialidase family protein [Vicinamibacterales bacterium]|jgi:hypothetical protein|nr:sialidase family protein [Vicinamibacterales bacterium]